MATRIAAKVIEVNYPGAPEEEIEVALIEANISADRYLGSYVLEYPPRFHLVILYSLDVQ